LDGGALETPAGESVKSGGYFKSTGADFIYSWQIDKMTGKPL